jgi:hypothetical protein
MELYDLIYTCEAEAIAGEIERNRKEGTSSSKKKGTRLPREEGKRVQSLRVALRRSLTTVRS